MRRLKQNIEWNQTLDGGEGTDVFVFKWKYIQNIQTIIPLVD